MALRHMHQLHLVHCGEGDQGQALGFVLSEGTATKHQASWPVPAQL